MFANVQSCSRPVRDCSKFGDHLVARFHPTIPRPTFGGLAQEPSRCCGRRPCASRRANGHRSSHARHGFGKSRTERQLPGGSGLCSVCSVRSFVFVQSVRGCSLLFKGTVRECSRSFRSVHWWVAALERLEGRAGPDVLTDLSLFGSARSEGGFLRVEPCVYKGLRILDTLGSPLYYNLIQK